eukprot:scaffold202505_cov28-Tisochrysis_lutea.AAC.4
MEGEPRGCTEKRERSPPAAAEWRPPEDTGREREGRRDGSSAETDPRRAATGGRGVTGLSNVAGRTPPTRDMSCVLVAPQ